MPRARRSVSAEDAIRAALERGEQPQETMDAGGHQLIQRPISLGEGPRSKPKPATQKRVLVYHQRNARCQLPDGTMLQPHAKCFISAEDANAPWLREHLLFLDPGNEQPD
jgi:hypothetical protein